MYADYGFDQAQVWEKADYDTFLRQYAAPDEVRAEIGDWFMENCGMDLQGLLAQSRARRAPTVVHDPPPVSGSRLTAMPITPPQPELGHKPLPLSQPRRYV